MVELTIVKIIGTIFIIFGGYLEYKYRFSGFDQNRFDPWTERHRKRYPDFEKDEAEEYYKEHEGAFIGQWGEKEFLKQQNRGKVFGIFFLVLGALLSIFG